MPRYVNQQYTSVWERKRERYIIKCSYIGHRALTSSLPVTIASKLWAVMLRISVLQLKMSQQAKYWLLLKHSMSHFSFWTYTFFSLLRMFMTKDKKKWFQCWLLGLVYTWWSNRIALPHGNCIYSKQSCHNPKTYTLHSMHSLCFHPHWVLSCTFWSIWSLDNVWTNKGKISTGIVSLGIHWVHFKITKNVTFPKEWYFCLECAIALASTL